jgi:leader peptidase (prepilin peptidase)/N-methyltransferase
VGLGLSLPVAIDNLWPAFELVMCCFIALAVFLILHLVYPAGLGMADVKLAGVIGLVTGWVLRWLPRSWL